MLSSTTVSLHSLRQRSGRRRLRVLLAEDDEGVREGFKLYFETVGLEVHTADDGNAAVRTAKETLPDVIVLDVRMPGLDGHEVTRALRGTRTTSRTPIVLLTGALPPGGTRPDRHGADATVLKPCAPAELLALIRRLGGRA